MNAVLWWALAAVTLSGALVVLLAREMMRVILGLGAFLLGVAALYAFYGFDLLAVAEIFVYVGGVLVLFVFAIAAMGRDHESREIARRFEMGPAVVSVGIAATLALALSSTLPAAGGVAGAGVDATASALLGPLLPQFELVGVLLLAALAAALAIVDGGDDR